MVYSNKIRLKIKHIFRCITYTFLFIEYIIPAQAQSAWNWPEDKKTAQSYYARYTDALASKQYKESVAPLEWLLEYVPQLNKSIYQNGTIIYAQLAQLTSDSTLAVQHKRRVFELLKLRETYYGEAATVAKLQTKRAYQLYKDTPQQLPFVIESIRNHIELNKEEVSPQTLLALLDILRRQKKAGQEVSKETFINAYNQISDIIDHKKERAAQDTTAVARLNKTAQQAERILFTNINIDCAFVSDVLGKRMQESHQTLLQIPTASKDTTTQHLQEAAATNAAKTFLRFMKTYNCTANELYLEAIQILYTTDPSPAMATLLASKFLKENDTDQALKYYEEALTLSSNTEEQAELSLNIARVYAQKNNKIRSRSYAQKALKVQPHLKDAYNLIGSLYISSYQMCKKGESQVEDRAIFIAAYNMFKRANNSEMMQKAKEQFPTTEQLFELGLSEGTKIRVPCWIDEEVVLIKASSL